MTKEEFWNLGPGDIVRGKLSARSYIVTANYHTHVEAVRTVNMTRADEWELIKKQYVGERLPMKPRLPESDAETS